MGIQNDQDKGMKNGFYNFLNLSYTIENKKIYKEALEILEVAYAKGFFEKLNVNDKDDVDLLKKAALYYEQKNDSNKVSKLKRMIDNSEKFDPKTSSESKSKSKTTNGQTCIADRHPSSFNFKTTQSKNSSPLTEKTMPKNENYSINKMELSIDIKKLEKLSKDKSFDHFTVKIEKNGSLDYETIQSVTTCINPNFRVIQSYTNKMIILIYDDFIRVKNMNELPGTICKRLKSFNRDYFVTTSPMGKFSIWNFKNFEFLSFSSESKESKSVLAHKKTIMDIKELLQGKMATASLDKTIKIWDLNSRKLEKTLELNAPIVHIKVFFDRYLIAATTEKKLHFYDLETLELKEIVEAGDNVSTTKINKENNTLLAGTVKGSINIYEIKDSLEQFECKKVDSFDAHKMEITKLIFTPSNKLLSSSFDKTIKLWDLKDKTFSNILDHEAGIYYMKQFKDGSILSKSFDRMIKRLNPQYNLLPIENDFLPKVWDYHNDDDTDKSSSSPQDIHSSIVSSNQRAQSPISANINSISELITDFDIGSRKLCLASNDNDISVWNFQPHRINLCCTLKNHRAQVNSIKILANNFIISGSGSISPLAWNDNTLRIWTFERHIFEKPEDYPVNKIKILNDLYFVYSTAKNIKVGVSSLLNLHIYNFSGDNHFHEQNIVHLKKLPNRPNDDSIYFASICQNNYISIWKLIENRENPDMERLFGKNLDRLNQQEITKIKTHRHDQLILGCEDGSIGIWKIDYQIGQLNWMRNLPGQEGRINFIKLMDDNYLVSGSEDGFTRLWNLTNDNDIRQREPVECVPIMTKYYNHENVFLASRTENNHVILRVFGLSKNELVADYPGILSYAKEIDPLTGNATLVLGHEDGTIRIFKIDLTNQNNITQHHFNTITSIKVQN